MHAQRSRRTSEERQRCVGANATGGVEMRGGEREGGGESAFTKDVPRCGIVWVESDGFLNGLLDIFLRRRHGAETDNQVMKSS